MRRHVIAACTGAAVSIALCGALAAQERMRIDLGDRPTDARTLVDELNKAIAVEPVTPPAGGGMPGGPPPPTGGGPGLVGVSLMLKVEFGFGSSGLTPKAMGTLGQVALALNDPKLEQHRFVVEGHTDSVGSDESNVRLSQQRALSVVTYLQQRGVRADRLAVMGLGRSHPLPGVVPTDGRNRRVEIVPVRQ
jgi:outer membrane protein OmpA-like peptidoglycan-associated protein